LTQLYLRRADVIAKNDVLSAAWSGLAAATD